MSRRIKEGRVSTSNNPASIYNWRYRGRRCDLVQIGLKSAVITQDGTTFIIGQKAISQWLR